MTAKGIAGSVVGLSLFVLAAGAEAQLPKKGPTRLISGITP